jgi:putative ABC transport system permease protein
MTALVRQSIRAFGRRPVNTAALILTLAIGVAAITTAFSIVDAVLLRPLPFLNAAELVALWQGGARGTKSAMSPANAADWKREARAFTTVGLWTGDSFTIARDGEGERVAGARVSGEFFATLGVPPRTRKNLHDCR